MLFPLFLLFGLYIIFRKLKIKLKKNYKIKTEKVETKEIYSIFFTYKYIYLLLLYIITIYIIYYTIHTYTCI